MFVISFQPHTYLEGQGCGAHFINMETESRDFESSAQVPQVAGSRTRTPTEYPSGSRSPGSFHEELMPAVPAVCICQGPMQKSQNRLGLTSW